MREGNLVDQIKAQIIGKKWKWASGGVNGTIRYKRNGSIFVTISTSIKQDTGTWRFKGNRLCTSYKKIRSGKEACVTYTKKGSQFVASNGGVLSR